jgi:diguanylate cyclase (GGDEF)-like protein
MNTIHWKNVMTPKKRYNIGFQINALSSSYGGTLINAIRKKIEQLDHNLIVFPGSNLNNPDDYGYQNNVLYSYINKCNIDALIMASGTLCNFITNDEFMTFCDQFKSFPIVSLNIEIENTPSILIDNRTGIIEAVKHLYQTHKCYKIAFIKGPEENPEAQARLDAFMDAHKKLNIPCFPELIISGDFTPSGGSKAAEYLLENNLSFDAIISANDDMAIAALQYLESAGILAPKDYAIIGFDDTEGAEHCTPPLSTISQNLVRQSHRALGLAIDLCNKKDVPCKSVITTNLITRYSCGCLPLSHTNMNLPVVRTNNPSAPPEIPVEYTEMFNTLDTLINQLTTGKSTSITILNYLYSVLLNCIKKGMKISTWQDLFSILYCKWTCNILKPEIALKLQSCFQQSRIIIADAIKLEQTKKRLTHNKNLFRLQRILSEIMSVDDLSTVTAMLKKELPACDFPSCVISFYHKEYEHLRNEKWIIPEYAEILLAYIDGLDFEADDKSMHYNPQQAMFPKELFPTDRRFSFVAQNLYFKQVQFGLIIYEIRNAEITYYDTMVMQLSNILKGALLYTARKKAEDDLKIVLMQVKDTNNKLQDLSQTDELTGLYNRRGFLNIAQQSLSLAIQMGKKGLVFFADLDHLKPINDIYGHKEGDFVIKQAADILRKSFRGMDIIARIGGDEFTVLAINADDTTINILKERISHNVDTCNTDIRKEYKISLSVGVVAFTDRTDSSIKELLAEADKILYEQKKRKKKSTVQI